MAHAQKGRLELRLNDDRSQALVNIYPSRDGGDPVTITEVHDRLKGIGVTYGIRDQSIAAAISQAEEYGNPVMGIVAAQGETPQDGKDARVQFTIPQDVLSRPFPRRQDGLPIPDWFQLDKAKFVRPGQELGTIIPGQVGIPGKTLTWPIKPIPPKHGKAVPVCAGLNVQNVDGTKLVAASEGYAILHGEQLNVHGIRIIEGNVRAAMTFSEGAVIHGDVTQSRLRSDGFIAINGRVMDSWLRADQDIVIRWAENCEIITPGAVYVLEGLKNCCVTTRKHVTMLPGGTVVGGRIYAGESVSAGILGSEDFEQTEVRTGTDWFAEVRNQEIQEELAACDANIKRISQALQPFTTHAVHSKLTEDKRMLLQKLQQQKRSQDTHINELHNERRTLSFARKVRHPGAVTVSGTAWPGVWIETGAVAMQVEVPMANVRFVTGASGKSIEVESLAPQAGGQKAA